MATPYLEKALNLVGDQNAYQKYLILFTSLIFVETTFILLGSPFIFLNPMFNCSFSQTRVSEQLACQNISQCRIIDFFTLTASSQLYCQRQDYRQTIQSILYVGSVIGLLTMGMISDQRGRKYAFLMSFMFCNVGTLLLLFGGFIKSVILMCIAQIIIGFGGYSTIIIVFIFIGQMCEDKLRQKTLMGLNGIWALTEMSFYVLYSLKINWFSYLFGIVFIPSFCLLIIGYFFLVQTPKYYITKRRNQQKGLQSLKTIAKYNGKRDSQIKLANQQLDQAMNFIISIRQSNRKTHTNQQHDNVFYIFKSKKYMFLIFMIAIVQITSNMYYIGVQYSLQKIGDNFGKNIFFAGFIEAIAYFSIAYFVTTMKRKNCLFYFNLGSIIVGLMFQIQFLSQSTFFSTMLLCSGRFLNTISLGIIILLQNESFPVTLQSTGWGMIQSISQIGNMMAPFIVNWAINNQNNPITIISIVMIIFGLLPIRYIKQTLRLHNEPLPSQIHRSQIMSSQIQLKLLQKK